MPYWPVAPVSEQPELTLTEWRIYQVQNGDRHAVGWCVEERSGRVSSAIQEVDWGAARLVTASGRVYELQGWPGNDPDARYTWNRWKEVNEVQSAEDVTAEVWAEIQRSRNSHDTE